MIRRALAALFAIACVLLAAGCGDEEPAPDTSSETDSSPTPEPSVTTSESVSAAPSPTPEPSITEDAGQVIEITFDGDDVTPNGDRVEVRAGEPVELDVTADVAGEIHVHSQPEQELEYGAGQTTLSLTIDQPGIVELESHSLEKVIVQLEVQP